MKQIKITHNFDLLARHGGEAYAEKYAGSTHTVESFDSDGWAYVKGAKFHPSCFRLTYNPIAAMFHKQRQDGFGRQGIAL